MKRFKIFLIFLISSNIILLFINLYTIFAFINSASEKLISVPDVRNKDIISATKILVEKGFKPKIQGILMDRKKEDLIILDQNPLSKAPEGSIVELWLNQSAKTVLLPDLRFETVESARNKLEKLGLRVEVTPSEEGVVVRQIPDANFYIEKGSNVLLWVETYRTPIEEKEFNNTTP
ncbi:MAG: PASTA domain-containing protein [Dictyoglomus sp.]|nr:PASTA domain-containing protein [Dictyoglomus sp.]MCX7942568.1 PASTA domain-containing protein [Dictyoglomaceae bacterium]MDW8188806.1 PASTA domain-containing protein [Dictyoglomus sp.]